MSGTADIYQLDLTESKINTALDLIIERCSSLQDNSGNQLFPLVDRGLWIPKQDQRPHPDQVPALLLWHNHPKHEVRSQQFFAPEIDIEVDFYLYLYSFAEDSAGHPQDLQRQRERIIRALLRGLAPPYANNPDGIKGNEWWRFTAPQEVHVDHTSPFLRFGQPVPPRPPWFISRIPISIRVVDKGV
ncbi:MAG: hypothetical protein KGL39_58875 [Patescibacteria group bacterium]|nr:hypothetical protein [Patescibacteria group bacterium]